MMSGFCSQPPTTPPPRHPEDRRDVVGDARCCDLMSLSSLLPIHRQASNPAFKAQISVC